MKIDPMVEIRYFQLANKLCSNEEFMRVYKSQVHAINGISDFDQYLVKTVRAIIDGCYNYKAASWQVHDSSSNVEGE